MAAREAAVNKSIVRAIDSDDTSERSKSRSFLSQLFAFFTFLQIRLVRFGAKLLGKLHGDVWKIDEAEYKMSFRGADGKARLKNVGDLGYSGSTFFRTADSKYLVKSLPRRFEYTFFQDDLLQPYHDYMAANAPSLLVRITDFLIPAYTTIGGLVGLVPTHHIVMENIMYGKELDDQNNKWETYDLKPLKYFYPERDLVPDALTSEDTVDRLADRFEDRIRIRKEEFDDLWTTLEKDTAFLEEANAVDYSLFLVRFPASSDPPTLDPGSSAWRKGVVSIDRKWRYRAVLLDFFWAKHKVHAQVMTGAVDTFNLVAEQGPMSITTTPDEYRKSFLGLVNEIVEVQE